MNKYVYVVATMNCFDGEKIKYIGLTKESAKTFYDNIKLSRKVESKYVVKAECDVDLVKSLFDLPREYFEAHEQNDHRKKLYEKNGLDIDYEQYCALYDNAIQNSDINSDMTDKEIMDFMESEVNEGVYIRNLNTTVCVEFKSDEAMIKGLYTKSAVKYSKDNLQEYIDENSPFYVRIRPGKYVLCSYTNDYDMDDWYMVHESMSTKLYPCTFAKHNTRHETCIGGHDGTSDTFICDPDNYKISKFDLQLKEDVKIAKNSRQINKHLRHVVIDNKSIGISYFSGCDCGCHLHYMTDEKGFVYAFNFC